MRQLFIAVFLTLVAGMNAAKIALADNHTTLANPYPVIAQFALRDRTVVITSAPTGYLYSITDENGSVLVAGLTEEQISSQYPDLFEVLRPAIAKDMTGLMMYTPKAYR